MQEEIMKEEIIENPTINNQAMLEQENVTMLEVKTLSKSFEGFKALTDVNLKIKKGSIYGLIGANGSGKTTLIKHLVGVYKQDKGGVLIKGQEIGRAHV